MVKMTILILKGDIKGLGEILAKIVGSSCLKKTLAGSRGRISSKTPIHSGKLCVI